MTPTVEIEEVIHQFTILVAQRYVIIQYNNNHVCEYFSVIQELDFSMLQNKVNSLSDIVRNNEEKQVCTQI